jgi:hypothetical protein
MTYKTLKQLEKMIEVIEDYKRELISEEQLTQEVLDLYKALEREREVKKIEKSHSGKK